MKLKERIEAKKLKLLNDINHGREISKQKEDERKRKRVDRVANMKPGAGRAMAEGLVLRRKPWDVMKEEYGRRKYERKIKYSDKGEDGSGSD